ncbi:MAG: glycosyltransferase family 39 protein, partial [Euryarchaeota archaeon]|nr:glycosyltransferase family 39 protein [Euryarchaeota archaeon]
DGREYNTLALRVASGAGYGYGNSAGQGTSFRAPGFPLFLAGVYYIFGENYVSAYLAFCALGALSCLLTYYLAREVLSEGFSRVAALFAVFYFPHVYYATIFASENLFAPCLAMGLWLFLKHLRGGSLLLLLGAAGALGWERDLKSVRFRAIWLTILGTGTVFSGLGYDPVEVIVFAQVANGILLPILALFLISAMNNEGLLGEHTNSRLQNALGAIVTLVVVIIGIQTIYDTLIV